MQNLRNYIRKIISEAAVNPNAAAQQGLALLVINGRKFILYNPKILEAFAENLKQDEDYNKFDILNEDHPDLIVGYISLSAPAPGSCYNANEVLGSAAQKGYGPMMYDIAMGSLDTVMSDRNSVTQAASGVWKYYKDNRSDVKKLPFDDIDNTKTPPEEDDCKVFQGRDELNYAYEKRGADSSAGLLNNHEAFIKEFSKQADLDEKDIVRMISIRAEQFFDEKVQS